MIIYTNLIKNQEISVKNDVRPKDKKKWDKIVEGILTIRKRLRGKEKKYRARSSITGKYVSLEYAKKHPKTTEVEAV